MKYETLATFEVTHTQLSWPWIAMDASRTCLVFPATHQRFATRVLSERGMVEGRGFDVPEGVVLSDIRGFSIDATHTKLCLAATIDDKSFIVTTSETGEQLRTPMASLTDADARVCAITWDRTGKYLWVSAERPSETLLLMLDGQTHSVMGIARSAAFPPPAVHELYLHPQDDAVLLLAACGQDGTFARLVGWSGTSFEVIHTALDDGGASAGMVGFSSDGLRVHLAESDALRTHSWPTLHELSSAEFTGDFVSNYTGAVFGHHVYIDGEFDEVCDDAVMVYDRTALRGKMLPGPVMTGMWVGRLGADCLVTVAAKGDPGCATVVRIVLPDSQN
jgi:hypothetical protein